ncbi:hypothetical protein D9619_008638 [Psilocybe cf. subviscida]|uniref:SMODS and SLOG-associating 2TM effector domain-containing protein n=1 Tax=Psilocybe cf. subviscida TaxID=2480587 RepID=A0A8H5BBK6_9AGAR|nr:hypothetical protein D9619_008638 [Psilocybe cf. subviscida]
MASYLQPIPRVAATESEEERTSGPPVEATASEVGANPRPTATSRSIAPRHTSSPLRLSVGPRLAFLDESETEKYPLNDSDKENTKAGSANGDDVSPVTPVKPLPAYPAEAWGANGARMPEPESRGGRSRHSTVRRQSALDWIVPHSDELNIPAAKIPRDRTVGDRLDPTLIKAQTARETFAFQAELTGYALNGAIGMQVVLGALTTGLSVVTTGKQTSIMTAILGGISTIVASYLAKARGSNEPENSISKIKDLEQFIRDLEAFRLDHGHVSGDKHDTEIGRFRQRFEELLGNINNEKHTTPPV